MTVITDLRTELAGFLTAGGLDVVDYIPESFTPPLTIVSAGDPFISEVFDAKTFNHDYQVNMEVVVVAGHAVNRVSTNQLDDLLYKVITSLTGKWTCEVSQPFGLQAGGAEYLAAKVSISTTISIN